MDCIVIGTEVIDCDHPDDPLRQRLHSSISFVQTLSRAGSEWNRSIADPMSLSQSEYLMETLLDPITFVQTVIAARDLPRTATSAIVFVSDANVSGGRFPSTGGGAGGDEPIEATFTSTAVEGMVLYVPSNATVDLAQADSASTWGAIGIAHENVSAAALGDYVTEGQITKTDWTTVTGSVSLTPGATYYLSAATPGFMTSTPPSTTGQSVVVVGHALTTQIFDIEIAQPILL